MSGVTPKISHHVMRLLMRMSHKPLNIDALVTLFPVHLSRSLLLDILLKLKELGVGSTTLGMYVLATSFKTDPGLIWVCSSRNPMVLAIMIETLEQWQKDHIELFPDSEFFQAHAGAADEEREDDETTEHPEEDPEENAEVSDADENAVVSDEMSEVDADEEPKLFPQHNSVLVSSDNDDDEAALVVPVAEDAALVDAEEDALVDAEEDVEEEEDDLVDAEEDDLVDAEEDAVLVGADDC